MGVINDCLASHHAGAAVDDPASRAMEGDREGSRVEVTGKDCSPPSPERYARERSIYRQAPKIGPVGLEPVDTGDPVRNESMALVKGFTVTHFDLQDRA